MLTPYSRLWRLSGARALLIGGIVARLELGITTLALLLTVVKTTGRYSPAAIAVAVFAVTKGLAGPLVGRLADRVGPAPVLRMTAIAHPAALLALVFICWESTAVVAVWVASAVAGATYPPVSAAVRGAWAALTTSGSPHQHLRPTALAADSALIEVIFVLGPLLVAGFVALGSAGMTIVAAAAATFAGTLLVASSPAIRHRGPAPPRSHTRGLGPLRVPGFGVLLFCAGTLGIAFGAAGVAVPAFAAEHPVPLLAPGVLASLLLAVWSIGSLVGAIWFGARTFVTPLARQYTWLMIANAAGFAVLALMPNSVTLGLGLLIGGATIAPALVVQNMLVGQVVPARMHNEAYSWLMTTTFGFSAMGAALTGVLADYLSVTWSFVLFGLMLALGAIAAASFLRQPPVGLGEPALSPAPTQPRPRREVSGLREARVVPLSLPALLCDPVIHQRRVARAVNGSGL